MWKEQAVEKAKGFLYGIEKKACCIMCRFIVLSREEE